MSAAAVRDVELVWVESRRRLQPFAFDHEGEVLTIYAYDLEPARRMFAAWAKGQA